MGDLIKGAGQLVMATEQSQANQTAITTQLNNDLRAANFNIADTQQRGAAEAGRIRSSGSQLAAAQKVAYANSGVDASVGTAADVQASTAALAELDAQTAKNNAALDVWKFKQQKTQARDTAKAARSANDRETAGAVLGGIASWTNGIASMAGKG
jgi:hypothetical protein